MVYVVLSKAAGISADDAADLVRRGYPEIWTEVKSHMLGFGSVRAAKDPDKEQAVQEAAQAQILRPRKV